MMSSASRVCTVCANSSSAYTCPCCTAAYCSLPCYKAHSSACTEAFYAQQVREALHSERVSTDAAAAMRAALVEHQRCCREHDAEIEQLQADERLERLARLDLLTLEHLDDAQRRRFFAAVRSGELGARLPRYRPWWLNPLDVDAAELLDDFAKFARVLPAPDLVRDANNDDDVDGDIADERTAASTSATADKLRFEVTQVLLVYALLMRRFHGDWSWEGGDAEALRHLLLLTPALGVRDALPLGGVVGILDEVLAAAQRLDAGGARDHVLVALADVVRLITRISRAREALQQLSALAERGDALLSRRRDRRALVQAQRKLVLMRALLDAAASTRVWKAVAHDVIVVFQRCCRERAADVDIERQLMQRQRDAKLVVLDGS